MDIIVRKEFDIELINVKVKVEQVVLVCSVFFVNMSYEICIFMNVIIGFSDILMIIKLDVDQNKYLLILCGLVCLLLYLLDDILDSVKLEKGKMMLELCDFFFFGLIDLVVLMFWIQVCNKGLILEMYIDEMLDEFY